VKFIFCAKCGTLLKKSDKVCPKCGTPVLHDKKEFSDVEELTLKRKAEVEKRVVLSENMSTAKREQLEKEAQKNKAAEQKILEKENAQEMSKTKQKKLAKDKAKTKKKKTYNHKKVRVFEARDDGKGGIGIDVSDSTFLDETKNYGENIKANKSTGSSKKYKIPEKLKWFEIAKWADRMLARRKVKKAVNKAATEIPETVSKGAMVALCICFGYMGAHSFYAKNYIKGCISLFSVIISIVVISIDVLTKYVGVSIGGGFGLVFTLMWIFDIFAIIFNKYRYRTSKNKFIATLNFDTRAILGRKYIKKEIAEMEQNEQGN